jgi:PAS domain S-box-containing protein
MAAIPHGWRKFSTDWTHERLWGEDPAGWRLGPKCGGADFFGMLMKREQEEKGGDSRSCRMPSDWPAGAQYAFALALISLSLLARLSLDEMLAGRIPFSLTLGVLLPLVLLVRPGPFMAAVVLGWFGALYLFVPPAMSLALAGQQEILMGSLYTVVLGLAAVAAWLSRRAMDARERDVAALRASLEREKLNAGEARAADAKFRAVFHQAGIFGGIMDLEGRVQEANELCVKVGGYRAEEVVGIPFWEGPWWRGSEKVKRMIREATACAAAGEVYRNLLPYWWADGSEHVVELAVHPIFDDTGKVIFLHPTGLDITDRRRAEEQLRRSHETFFSLIQNAPFGVFIVDSGLCLRQVSAGARVVFQDVDPLVGGDFAGILRAVWEEPFASEAVARFRHTLQSGEPYVVQVARYQRRGRAEIASYDWRIERVVLPDGQSGVVCYFYDLSEIMRVEEELRHRSEQLETLLNAAPLGVYLVDSDFRVAQINPVALPTFENVSDVIGRDFAEVLHIIWKQEVADEVVRIFRHTLDTGEAHHAPELGEFRADRGVIEYYEWRVNRIKLPDGRYGVVCYFSDVSGQVRARQAIAASEARYRTLFESMDEAFCVIEMIFDDAGRPVDFHYLETNPAFRAQTGLDNVVGRRATEVLNHEPYWFELYGKIALTGEAMRFENRVESLGRWFDVNAFRIGEPHQRRVALLFSDITERKDTEVALTAVMAESDRQRRLYDTIISSTPDLVYVFDLEYRFTFVNQALLKMWGRTLEEAIGRNLLENGYEPWHAEMHEREIDQVVATKQPVRGEVPFPHAALGQRIYDYIFVPVFNEAGEVELIAGTTRDITERKMAELELTRVQEELQQHAETLERTVAERTERLREMVAELEHFSYTITHDMRAPLRALQAFSQILREDYHSRLDEQGVDYLRRISESANRMDSLITDSLNYAKTVQTELVLEPVDPVKLLRGMVESYPQFQPPRAEILIEADLPLVMANQAGLTQCFSNLLGNAVKFVEPGKVPRIRVWGEERGDVVRLWVEDNGIGVPADQRERVFEMFQRLSKDFEGTGIGLALVRKVVEKMRGKVGLDPHPDGGSVFWVEFQRAQSPGSPKAFPGRDFSHSVQ